MNQIPDLRARELLTVVMLAEYGSFVAAAAHVRTSQPALTRTIKRVERILGVTLFSRNTRRVEITPAGREFVAVAERILNDLVLSLRNMSETATEQRGQITISTNAAFATSAMPELVRRYRDVRPAIDVRVREGRQPSIVEDVRGGVADFGIGYVNTLPDTLQSTPLRREPLYAVIPAGHRFAVARRPRVPLAELAAETLVTPATDSYVRRLVEGAAAAAGLTLRYGVTVDRLQTVMSLVRAGVGIGIAPAGVLPPKPWDGVHAALLVEPALSVSTGLITLRGRYTTPAAATFVDLAVRWAEQPAHPMDAADRARWSAS